MGYPRVGRGGKLKQTWSLLSDKEQIRFHALAVLKYYPVKIAFTLNLSPEYQRKSSRWIRRKIVRDLEASLGHRAAVVAVRDYTADDGRPHYHGAVGCHTNDGWDLVKQ